MSEKFVIIFCNEGLEGVIPDTDIERQDTWRALKGEPLTSKVSQAVNMAILRARFNTQRAYEIYGVEAEDGITNSDITDMFEFAPQTAADTIRRIGHKIHSDRADVSRVKIF